MDAGDASDSDSDEEDLASCASYEYHPEKIIDACKDGNAIRYLVVWHGYDDRTWETKGNQRLIREYKNPLKVAEQWPPTKTYKEVLQAVPRQ